MIKTLKQREHTSAIGSFQCLVGAERSSQHVAAWYLVLVSIDLQGPSMAISLFGLEKPSSDLAFI
jgi:hypothetical protein